MLFCCHPLILYLNKLFTINLFQCPSLRNTIRVSNNLDPDQDQLSVVPDLGFLILAPNCLQRTTNIATSMEMLT